MLENMKAYLAYTDTIVPVQGYTIVQRGPDQDDEETDVDDIGLDLKDLIGTVLGIEYVDSRRKSSIRQISVTKADVSYIGGYCYLRKRYRTFRIDRIQSIFDEDGVSLSTDEFLQKYNIGTSDSDTPLTMHEKWRDEIIILTALARSDGHFHPDEKEEIIRYVIEEAERSGQIPTDVSVGQLNKSISRRYPRPEVVSEALDNLIEKDKPHQERLLRAASRVINADGVQDDAEFQFLIALRSAFGM